MVKNLLRSFALSLTVILTFSAFATAQIGPNSTVAGAALTTADTGPTSPRTDFSGIKIGNFGQMDENFYRGAQPLESDYKSLAGLGIKTIIDLRDDATGYAKASAEAAGLKYVNIPMSGWLKPRNADIEKFLKIANDPATGKFFVHCKAGIHRTGTVGAIYRMTKYGWSYDQAYQEMKNYNFTAGLTHGSLKSYVKKYAQKLSTKPLEAKKTGELAKAAGQDN